MAYNHLIIIGDDQGWSGVKHLANLLSLAKFPETPTLDNWGPLVIPPGYYFMMGDSRYASKDSRFWGIVPRENFRGRPLFVYYSYNADDSDRAAPFITDIRWRRIGTWIR